MVVLPVACPLGSRSGTVVLSLTHLPSGCDMRQRRPFNSIRCLLARPATGYRARLRNATSIAATPATSAGGSSNASEEEPDEEEEEEEEEEQEVRTKLARRLMLA